jgi:hypothetical protein
VKRLDDDPEITEVVTPHMFEQFSVVLALHPDPAGTSDTCSAVACD